MNLESKKEAIFIGLFSFLLFLGLLFFEDWASGGKIAQGYRLLSLWLSFLASLGIGIFVQFLIGKLTKKKVPEYLPDPKPFLALDEESDWRERESKFLGALIPDLTLKKISGWDISAFPSTLQNPKADYIRILPTSDGFLGILAGFPESDVISSSQRLFVHGVVSAYEQLTWKTDEALSKLEKALHALTLKDAKISLFGFGKNREELLFYHAMEMPVFQLSPRGIEVLEGSGNAHWTSAEETPLSMADGVEVGDFLIWANDRVLQDFEMTPFEITETFVDDLLDLSPKNSKEVLLAIAQKMKALGKQKGIKKPIDHFSIVVVRRKR